jgi:transformation/transcription domain-associated protein
LALHDGSITGVTEAENILDQGVDLALNHWWQLPEMSVQSHVPLLQQFQQLVELQESARVLVEIGNGNNQHVGTTPLEGFMVAMWTLRIFLKLGG